MVYFLYSGIYNRGDIKVCLNKFEDALVDFNKAI